MKIGKIFFSFIGAFLLAAVLAAAALPVKSSLPGDYESWTAEAKQAFLWKERILPSAYSTLPSLENPGSSASLGLLSPRFLAQSFFIQGDEMPTGRVKLIHTWGTVAQVEYLPADGIPYTGIFQSGAAGLARLSLARKPDALVAFTPGMAIKFFVDQKRSVNLHLMHKLEGQGRDQNFFANDFTNDLPAPTAVQTKFLGWLFSKVKATPGHLRLSEVGGISRTGAAAGPHYPYKILFEPTASVQMDSRSTNDFRQNLAQIPDGTVLFDVWAKHSVGVPPQLIGRLVTRSPFVASSYGDTKLFSVITPIRDLEEVTKMKSATRRTPADIQIKPRKPDFEISISIPRHWADNEPVKTHLMDAFSVQLPILEQFFISIILKNRERVEDTVLKKEINGFCSQEGAHASEHRKYNDWLVINGYTGIRIIQKIMVKLVALAQKIFSKNLLLALTGAGEHITSFVGNNFLSYPEKWSVNSHPVMNAIWGWHAVEEIEHKAVCFDTYQQAHGKYILRVLALPVIVWPFLFILTVTELYMLQVDGVLFKASTWKNYFQFMYGRNGFAWGVTRESWKYLSRDFHPWQVDDRALVLNYGKSRAV